MASYKKVIVSKDSLPAINADTESYIVRFRVVSEDRNRVSHWSPQYILGLEPATVVESNIITVGTNIISIAWDPSDSPASLYDIYVAWGYSGSNVGSPTYFGTVAGSVTTIPIPAGAAAAKAYVQKVSYPKTGIVPSAIIAESPVTNL